MAENKDIATKTSVSIAPALIESRIFAIRGTQVMIDRDIAELYGIPTKRLNEQVKRNKERFPENFCFQLHDDETGELVANCDRLQTLKHSSVNPYCFTEQGVAMLSAVLRTETAVRVSVQIMEAFVEMRHTLAANAHIMRRLEVIEHHQLAMVCRQDKAEDKIEEVFRRLDEYQVIPAQGIFADGQIFDAYEFVERLIKSAKKSILLIDNYVDESVLTMMSEKAHGVQ
ncbi:MAG: ORF6N domain-containing protein, partial [Paludibacteraceae bacterium]|nr:ORF6N domain-containing protein [Paludibacteraceae bacterium]